MGEIRLSLDGMLSHALSSRCGVCIAETGVGCCKVEPLFTFFEIGSLMYRGFFDVVDELLRLSQKGGRVSVYGIQPLRVQDRCYYHTPEGCRLPDRARPLICNVFLCSDAEADVTPVEEGILRGGRDELMAWRASFNSFARSREMSFTDLLKPCGKDVLREISCLFENWLDRQDNYRKVLVFQTKS